MLGHNLFADAQIGAALDHLLRNQQPGGGWPITWEPPSEAATLEWRGVVTLQALGTLTSYGRVSGAQARANERLAKTFKGERRTTNASLLTAAEGLRDTPPK